jgi:hypothetical protein
MNPWTACFAAQYADCRGISSRRAPTRTCTMEPRLRGRVRRSAASVPWTDPRYVTSVTRRYSSGCISRIGENTDAIALLILTSIGPHWSSTASAAASSCSQSAASTGRTGARPAASSTSRCAAARRSSPRAIRPIRAPSVGNRTTARPTPAAAPGTTTVSVAALDSTCRGAESSRFRIPSRLQGTRRDGDSSFSWSPAERQAARKTTLPLAPATPERCEARLGRSV